MAERNASAIRVHAIARKAAAGRQRALAAGPIERRLEFGELLHRCVAARKTILGYSVDRNDQIGKEAAILRRDDPLMALQRKFILLQAADLPRLRHVLG